MKQKQSDVSEGMLVEVLAKSKPRPEVSDSQDKKLKYASRFAEHMADRFARDLKPRLKGIEASTKRSAGSAKGPTQLDANFSTPAVGLALGISLKSVHVRDKGSGGRYTHNMKRNEEELRIEASGYHKRQPYAVMVGVLFLPFDSCDDAKKGASSFGSWVRHLRPFTGRSKPAGDIDRFEKIYLALYESDGSNLRFFDVAADPPSPVAACRFRDRHHHHSTLEERRNATRTDQRCGARSPSRSAEPVAGPR
jgi:hypothetical protein